MSYQQVTSEERYSLSAYKGMGFSISEIARKLGKHRSTIYRELKRNRADDGTYKTVRACEKANARRWRTRRHSYFSQRVWGWAESLLKKDWSPEQISLVLRLFRMASISTETIYKWIWKDKQAGGTLYLHLRQCAKLRRKRYRAYDSRGVLKGKRPLTDRPRAASERSRKGHFEIDLVHGKTGTECILTLVDRKTRFLIIKKLRNKTVAELNEALIPLIWKFDIKTLSSDNGCEFHGYKEVEAQTGAKFYFAPPHQSWERGTIENTNGLIRQYLPKQQSMAGLTQWECNAIAEKLNRRPRKILNLTTPEAAYYDLPFLLHL
jgi:IS30 family transposase